MILVIIVLLPIVLSIVRILIVVLVAVIWSSTIALATTIACLVVLSGCSSLSLHSVLSRGVGLLMLLIAGNGRAALEVFASTSSVVSWLLISTSACLILLSTLVLVATAIGRHAILIATSSSICTIMTSRGILLGSLLCLLLLLIIGITLNKLHDEVLGNLLLNL